MTRDEYSTIKKLAKSEQITQKDACERLGVKLTDFNNFGTKLRRQRQRYYEGKKAAKLPGQTVEALPLKTSVPLARRQEMLSLAAHFIKELGFHF